MKYIADFHIHSRFSRATAKNLDFENLYITAQIKGISVVGTGDFTHPGWFSEIKEKLVPAEDGLFKLKDDIAKFCDQSVPKSCKAAVRFILVTEISNIYKKKDKTRKNHNLVFMPDLDVAASFNRALERIGNVSSDGRPILGLDARDLLEIVLEISEHAFLIPAHIWTPWFSILGSKSGFDSVYECFGDLTPQIFAVETGLSSDPGMNWRVSELDGFTLVSNSDAHSAANLGREANVFNTTLSYPAIKEALRSGDSEKFLGTIEFYPEEGKYHLDGHRKCQVRLHPDDTREKNGICPVCEKPLTLGVLYRVQSLSDRAEGEKPRRYHPYDRLIPLCEILSELLQVGSKSKKVTRHYMTLIQKIGPEFSVLKEVPISRLENTGVPLLSEAIDRMRQNKVHIYAGYDGEYGKITLFKSDEIKQLMGQPSIFKPSSEPLPVETKEKQNSFVKTENITNYVSTTLSRNEPSLDDLNAMQRRAVEIEKGPIMVVAGPGTGKTKTLTHRIAYLVTKRGVLAEKILAVTFTNKAAEEMIRRLKMLMGKTASLPTIGTFHSVCFKILQDLDADHAHEILDEERRNAFIKEAIKQSGFSASIKSEDIFRGIVTAKQQFLGPEDCLESIFDEKRVFELRSVYRAYQEMLSVEGFYDYEDLVFKVVKRFKKDPILLKQYQDRFKYIFVDEYQDLNKAQYSLIRALSPPGKDLFVIGDPDQSIYGFRGSNVAYFKKFVEDYPDAEVISLSQNYRSSKTILEASYQVIKDHKITKAHSRVYSDIDGINRISVLEAASEKAEAVVIGRIIEELVGGTGFHSVDFGKIDAVRQTWHHGFSDVGIFFRTGLQADIFAEVFDKAGIPYQTVSRHRLFSSEGVFDLMSCLKIIEGSACYIDLDIGGRLFYPSIGKATMGVLREWGYRNNFTLKQALWHARRIPIPGMRAKHQQNLCAYVAYLERMRKEIEGLSVEKKLLYIIEHTAIKKKITESSDIEESINFLLHLSKSYGQSTGKFLAAIALKTDTDIYNDRVQKVSLMTMHASKGLEFPVVFISGCEDGLIPYHHTDTDLDEERRLFYVAMTRAKEQLYLTRAKHRTIYGKRTNRKLSPFVEEIEASLRSHKKQNGGKSKKRKAEQLQLKLF
ncbi:MAG: UvrD-helicase domain-containing protein [Deltaproteobacteria bacterium]|nr:UvrD-helicase domain-containing protein [Deltaproteobacteria bacterium]